MVDFRLKSTMFAPTVLKDPSYWFSAAFCSTTCLGVILCERT